MSAVNAIDIRCPACRKPADGGIADGLIAPKVREVNACVHCGVRLRFRLVAKDELISCYQLERVQ